MDQVQTKIDPDFSGQYYAIVCGLLLKVERRVKPYATERLHPTGSFAAPVAFELTEPRRAAIVHLIGLIADTHGLVRPECAGAFEGVELILHAGDVGGAPVLAALARIAPVEAVAGNTDLSDDPGRVREIVLEFDGVTVRITHGHELGAPTPEKLLARYREDVLVYGHTHKPLIMRAGRQLVVNPGAAGPRRFRLWPSVAVLSIEGGHADARLITL